MQKQVAQAIVDVGPSGLQFLEAYSGRGMYGATTAAVTGDLRDFITGMLKVMREAAVDNDEQMMEALEETAENMRWGQMGRDDSVIY